MQPNPVSQPPCDKLSSQLRSLHKFRNFKQNYVNSSWSFLEPRKFFLLLYAVIPCYCMVPRLWRDGITKEALPPSFLTSLKSICLWLYVWLVNLFPQISDSKHISLQMNFWKSHFKFFFKSPSLYYDFNLSAIFFLPSFSDVDGETQTPRQILKLFCDVDTFYWSFTLY